jgi:hypothetical protein
MFTTAVSPKDGVDVVLSDELRASVQKALEENCKDIDTRCVEKVKALMVSPHTELEARQLGNVAVAAGAGLMAFFALAIPFFKSGQEAYTVPSAYHIPSSQVGPAVSAAKAATIIAGAYPGAPSITITLQPITATITGYVHKFRTRFI